MSTKERVNLNFRNTGDSTNVSDLFNYRSRKDLHGMVKRLTDLIEGGKVSSREMVNVIDMRAIVERESALR